MTAAAPLPARARDEARHYQVEGMHCASCAQRVESLVAAQPGVTRARVNFATAELQVDGSADEATLREALTEAGYDLHAGLPGSALEEEARGLKSRLLLAIAMSLPVFVLGMGGFGGLTSLATQALLASLVVLGCGAGFHRGALTQARQARANMDTLVSLGTLSALLFSFPSLWRGGPVFFESAAVIVTLILLGRWLELRARSRASDAVAKLAALAASEATVLRDGREVSLAAAELAVGDTLVIRPGDKVPADAVVLEGRSELFEAAFTGESLPREVGPGDEVAGAAVNGHGRLLARALRVGADTELAAIVRLVAETQASKAPVQRLVDAVAGRFVPAVLGIAALTLVGWLLAGAELPDAFSRAVAVLVIACPCALGLATPAAISAGSGRGAELGVLFKDAAAFERSRAIDTMVFDKTGTLTTGAMELREIHAETCGEDELLARTAAVEQGSEHAIARAVVDAARNRGVEILPSEDFRAEPGRGARARCDEDEVLVGSLRWMDELGIEIPAGVARAVDGMEARGATAVVTAWQGRARGALAVGDGLRDGAVESVATLRKQGLDVQLVTGDNPRAASAVAEALGIEQVVAEARPADKRAHVAALQAQGRRVAFVGDGINDAPALGQADLGLALAAGTDVAVESGDAVLVSSDPRTSVTALALARRTYRTIGENLVWAFAYNVAAIPAAAWGVLDPMIAAGAMALSSVSVVANSLRVRRFLPAAAR